MTLCKFTPHLHPVDSGTPSGLKYSEVRDSMVAVKGVTAVHNLHIWALTMNQAVLSAHVAIGENDLTRQLHSRLTFFFKRLFL